jgi:CRP/FNR family transcriptional regulator
MTPEKLSRKDLDRLLNTSSSAIESSDSELGPSFLHLLATAGRQLLSKLLTEHHYEPGHIIFREGDIGDTMYIIWSGRVAIVKGGFQSPTVLGYRGVGEIIGEMALLEDQPRSASVVAMEDLRTLRIRREDFEEWLSQNPSMGLSILGTLSARLRASDDARKASSRAETHLVRQVTDLQSEKQQLLELERLRQDTIDLIVHDLRHPISSLFGAVKILEMVLPEEVLEANWRPTSSCWILPTQTAITFSLWSTRCWTWPEWSLATQS